MVKNLPAMRETWVLSLGWEDPLGEGMATHSSILAWRIPIDRGAWWAAFHGVTKGQTSDTAQRPSCPDTTEQLSMAQQFSALEAYLSNGSVVSRGFLMITLYMIYFPVICLFLFVFLNLMYFSIMYNYVINQVWCIIRS